MTYYTIHFIRQDEERGDLFVHADDANEAQALGESMMIDHPSEITWEKTGEGQAPSIIDVEEMDSPTGLDSLEFEALTAAIGSLTSIRNGYTEYPGPNAKRVVGQLNTVITVLGEHLIDRNEG